MAFSLLDDDANDKIFDNLASEISALGSELDTKVLFDNKNPEEKKYEDNFLNSKLIIGIIDDNGIVRINGFSDTFPLDADGIVNQTRGTCCIKFFENGGIKNSGSMAIRKQDMPDDPDTVTKDHLETGSSAERVPLTSPFIWDNDNNWMGIDYLPPIGAKVILGFSQHNEIYILGYLSQRFGNHEYLKDRGTLQCGEMVLKGFGNNFIHFRKSNKLVLQTYSEKGKKDIDQPDGQKTASTDHKCEIFMDGDNGRITLSVGTNQLIISEDGVSINKGTKSGITLNESGISVNTTTLTSTAATVEQIRGNQTIS